MRMLIVPSPGLMVRHPTTQKHLPPEGLVDDANVIYWKRRENEGAVTIKPAPSKPVGKPVTPAQEE